jgi:hypothetical protein
MGHGIERKVGDAEHRGGSDISAQERADAGKQNIERERFREVVIGAQIQSADHVCGRAPGREHEDPQCAVVASKVPKNGEAVLVRKADVEDDEVKASGAGEVFARRSVRSGLDDIPFRLKSAFQQSGHFHFVFNNEDVHG